jgi:hypothetical protein
MHACKLTHCPAYQLIFYNEHDELVNMMLATMYAA